MFSIFKVVERQLTRNHRDPRHQECVAIGKGRDDVIQGGDWPASGTVSPRLLPWPRRSIPPSPPRRPLIWRQQTSPAIDALGACPNSRCSILVESDSTFGDEQVFSSLEYRSDATSAAECAGFCSEGPCLAVYR